MIYCVEDDQDIRNMILYTLKTTGFEAAGFEKASHLLQALESSPLPELILMDIMMPEMDGYELLSIIRNSPDWKEIPVILETAKTAEYDTVMGLDAGADDYLAKPFGMMEMVSRIKAVLRRTKRTVQSDILEFNQLCLNPHEHFVSVCGNPVSLTLKEFELLRYLMENRNQVLTRDQILEKIWNTSADIETRTVDVHINTLRTKLTEYAGCIQTVRGVGYRFGTRS